MWFALAQKLADRLECQGHLIQFDGDRDAVRRQAVEYALNLLRALPPPVAGMLRLFFALQPAGRAERRADRAGGAADLAAQGAAGASGKSARHAVFHRRGGAEEKLDALRVGRWPGCAARPATLHFDSLEYWRKPGVFCATAADTARQRRRDVLAERLAEATIAAGFSPDVKPFRAHLTLARKVQAAHAAACEWPRHSRRRLVVHCDRFVLMQSRRGETGSIYSVVDSWPLDATNPVKNTEYIQ